MKEADISFHKFESGNIFTSVVLIKSRNAASKTNPLLKGKFYTIKRVLIQTQKDAKTNTSYIRRHLPQSHNSYKITSREAEEDIWKTDEDALLVTIKDRHNKER